MIPGLYGFGTCGLRPKILEKLRLVRIGSKVDFFRLKYDDELGQYLISVLHCLSSYITK